MPTITEFPEHPWPKGFRLISVQGEQDDDDGQERVTGPNAEGVVDTIDHYPSKGWTYGVFFPASGVFIFLDQDNLLSDRANYRPA